MLLNYNCLYWQVKARMDHWTKLFNWQRMQKAGEVQEEKAEGQAKEKKDEKPKVKLVLCIMLFENYLT